MQKDSKLKKDFLEYKKILKGHVDYSKNITDIKTFDGLISLKRDPKGEKINCSNIIVRGSVLLYTEWVLGLVLYVGKNCHIY